MRHKYISSIDFGKKTNDTYHSDNVHKVYSKYFDILTMKRNTILIKKYVIFQPKHSFNSVLKIP